MPKIFTEKNPYLIAYKIARNIFVNFKYIRAILLYCCSCMLRNAGYKNIFKYIMKH